VRGPVRVSANPSRTLVVMAWLADHAGATIRQIATMLAGRSPTHSEVTSVHMLMRHLADRGDVEKIAGSYPGQWRILDSVPAETAPTVPAYPGADDLLPVRRVDVEACSHLLRAYLRTGEVGDPTRMLICRLDAILHKHQFGQTPDDAAPMGPAAAGAPGPDQETPR
jgi:hypothetical protein